MSQRQTVKLACGVFLALVLARVALSLLWLPATGAGLGDTEAYYTAWSFDPSLGYHDHPGMIAWLVAAARWCVPSDVAGRVVAASMQALTLGLMLVYWRGCSADKRGIGWIMAAVVFMAIPIYGTGGLLAAPDAPLAVAWAATLVMVSRARDRWGWCGVGLCAACAVASKLFGVVLVVAVLVEAWRSSSERRVGLMRVFTVGGLACLGFLPTLYFEARHGWTGLRYHLLERHSDGWFGVEHALASMAAQGLVLSPVLAVLLLGAVCPTRAVARQHAQAWRLTVMTLVPLMVLTLFTRESEPHWSALAWLPVLGPMTERALKHHSRWLSVGVVLGVGLQLLVWVHVMVPVVVGFIPKEAYVPRFDLANDLRGWDQVGEKAREMLLRGEVDRVAGYHYTVCGQLVVAVDDLSSVVCLSRRRDAFDTLLGGASGEGRVGERLLYIRDNRYDEQGPERLMCDAWDDEEVFVVRRGGHDSHSFGLRRCLGFRGLIPKSR